MGASTAEETSATRTNVVRTPWRWRRMSSATMPTLIMSWVAARLVISESESGDSPQTRPHHAARALRS